jgi:hypothetical protein
MGGTPKIRLLDTTLELGADEILSRPPGERGRPSEAREGAKEFLRDFLSDGGKPKAQIDIAAQRRSFSAMTLRRASLDLGIRKRKRDGRTFWSLP